MWQDEAVDDHPGEAEPAAPAATRTVDSVDSLRAMADPTRLAILTTLMQPRHDELPVMSAKELAAELGEPQTKLYRHIRQLEAAGLVRVAATRVVSGILEQRYQACQRDLEFGGGFLREHVDDTEAAIQAMLNAFRDGYFAAFRDPDLAPDAVPAEEAYRRPRLFAAESRVSRATAQQFNAKLDELIQWLGSESKQDPDDAVTINALIVYYARPDRAQPDQ